MFVKNGVVLGRFQVLSNGHLELIRIAAAHCEKVYIFIGSAQEYNTKRNPFTINKRKFWLEKSLETLGKYERNKIEIISLLDYTNEDDNSKDWGECLYNTIINYIKEDNFTLFTGEKFNFIKDWFSEEILSKIEIYPVKREAIANGVSSTKLRNAFLKKDINFIKENCPAAIVNDFDFIYQTLKDIEDEYYPCLWCGEKNQKKHFCNEFCQFNYYADKEEYI